MLDASAKDSAGSTVAVTISCNGGSLYRDNFLLTPKVTETQTIVCEATATGSTGATSRKQITFTVNPTISEITLLEAYGGTLAQGQTGALSAVGFPISAGQIRVTLGGMEIATDAISEETIALKVPANAQLGKQLIQVESANRIFSAEVEIVATTLRAPATQVVGDYLEANERLINDLIIAPNTTAAQAAGYRELLAKITTAKTEFTNLTASQVQSLALSIQANNLDFFSARTVASCLNDRRKFVIASIAIAAGIDLILLPEGISTVVGVAALYGGLREVDRQINSVGDCIQSFGDFTLDPFNRSGSNLIRVAAVETIAISQNFVNGTPKRFNVASKEKLAPEFTDLKFYIRILRSSLDYVPFVSEGLKSDIRRLDETRSVVIPADQVVVEKVSGEGINLTSSTSGAQLVITATTEDSAFETIPFTFTISAGGQTTSFSANLIGKTPVTYDIAAVATTTVTRIPLQAEGAQSFSIVRQPAKGRVEIDAETSEAIYYTDGEITIGQVEFDYIATNGAGESNISTVLVTVELSFDADFSIVLEEQIFEQKNATCVPQGQTLDVKIQTISPTELRIQLSPYRDFDLEPAIMFKDGPGEYGGYVDKTETINYADGSYAQTGVAVDLAIKDGFLRINSRFFFRLYEGPNEVSVCRLNADYIGKIP